MTGPARRRPAPRRDPQADRENLIYGRNAVLEAARAGRVLRVLMAERLEPDPRLGERRRVARVEDGRAERVAALAQGAHQGVVAELKPRRYLTLRELLATEPTLLVALDGIEDPQNLGAILRSAEAAGADGVILPERRTAPLSGAAVKASSGASEHLRICRVAGLPSTISELKRAGIWCTALDPRGEQLAWEVDLRQRGGPPWVGDASPPRWRCRWPGVWAGRTDPAAAAPWPSGGPGSDSLPSPEE